ncbi:serine/threonine-protein kinase [Desulfosarcina ovata]|uniref:Protein kinase domain-containing protein n=1 Tax=Desulfosarcina ovata subsp. ovata TaxID=2752305 RepID=A0A5K8ABG0_9BACT|nr:serine/threonine-protein kinase [Desulfosarcina ovata]BBO90043.1 hypothetical protein DSCOOX_32230 [Desulfosarcina ovata subsp. ovata]
MKKWMIPIVFSVLCATVISAWELKAFVDRQVIYIRGAEPLLVDETSQSDQFVYYKADGKSGMFMKNDVVSVGSIRVEKKRPILSIIDRHKQQIFSRIGIDSKMTRLLDTRLLIFLILLILSFTAMKVGGVLLSRLRNRDFRRSGSTAVDAPNEALRWFPQESQEGSDFRDIALFFLELYRIQNGFPKDAPARFSMTPDSAKQKMKVFELGVKGSRDWLTRRMSIGPLGEDSGSKSKCFYAIYDTHMVIKIPPVPVTDIVKYVKDIRREVQISIQLAPVACIVPMVSVVLNKIKALPYASSLTAEQSEKQYIRLVEGNTEYQDYLKIGGRFAFFMELSNSFFVGRVIDELHAAKANIGDELMDVPDAAWDQEAFTTRYGLDSLSVFEGLQTLYHRCENEARRIIQAAGKADQVHSYQIKDWFLAAIAGKAPVGNQKEKDSSLIDQVNEGFAGIFKAHQPQMDALTQLLKAQLEIKTFLKSRHQIENIASNMLQLLCLLEEKKVALRDLKPDNLFFAADPDSYPIFLNNAEDFSIGVIDVETAVSLDPTKDGTIAQPLLGGTPLYATPLHILKNDTITANFGSLAKALHYQDWYAAMAIIFKAVTGNNLFPRAARSFPEMLKILKSGRSKSDPDETTVKAMSHKFWSAATADLKAQLAIHSAVLTQVSLDLPEAMVPVIREQLEREKAALTRFIGKQIAETTLLKSEKNRTFLLTAASPDIARQIERWQNHADLPESHRGLAPQMVAFLNNLNRLKQRAAEKQDILADLSAPPYPLSAHVLLESMFQIVHKVLN